MGKQLNTRLREHQTDARNVPQVYTRSERKSSETYSNQRAVTDNIAEADNAAHCEGAKLVSRENNQRLRQVKEAIKIS